MKKILCLLFAMLMLAGCQTQTPAESTAPELTQLPWDDAGVLTQVSLDIPDLWSYRNFLDFQGQLLLWTLDTHRADSFVLELCLVDPDTGAAIRESVPVDGYLSPQVFGGSVYLCCPDSGQVLELDGSLLTQNRWQIQPGTGEWFIGQGPVLYRIDESQSLIRMDLNTGQTDLLLECATLSSVGAEFLILETDDGWTALNRTSGALEPLPFQGEFAQVSRAGDTWLCCLKSNGAVYYFGPEEQPLRTQVEGSALELLKDGTLLERDWDSQDLRLYRPDGSFVSGCCLSGSGDYYSSSDLVYSESRGGYYFLAEDINGSLRLLFWDLDVETDAPDLDATAVPSPSDGLEQMRQRAQALGDAYGVEILLGSQCQTEYAEFTTQTVEDWETISMALDHLQEALQSYPEGYFRQLRFYDTQGVQIHLVGDLYAASRSNPTGYVALAYPGGDHFIVAADMDSCGTESYFHEFSHITDLFLDWDASTRDGALYSEDGWQSLNPEDFSYSFDYNAQPDYRFYEDYGDYFIDTYAMINPTEDRARVMEFAMSQNSDWAFAGRDGLMRKLDYYSRCIRDAFDTTGWPETTRWEQNLS